MVVHWATRLRGFFQHMSPHMEDVKFVSSKPYYEVNNIRSKVKSKLIRSRLFDFVGLFQIIKISDKNCDCYGSFNRFLKADKPYFLYLENPTALYHYSLGRIRSKAGKRRFEACLADSNLKYIVCMANACKDTFEKVNMPLPGHIKVKTIYPFVPKNPYVDEQALRAQSQSETLECLFCVQGRRFITKGGLDVLTAFSNLKKEGHQIHLTIITKISDLDIKTFNRIKACEGVSLYDFTFSYRELEKVYANTNVLLQPSSDDSCSLTVLEAMKGGCAIIASRLYAFPEMVENNDNGYLIDPKFRMFTHDNIPNEAAWNHRKKRQLAKKKDAGFVRNIENAIFSLYADREKLYAFSRRSLEIANTKFGEETIINQWKDVWSTLEGEFTQ